jgi:hypothetical protein
LFNVSIDLSELQAIGLNVDEKFKKIAWDAQRELANQTFSRITEMAGERLHSRLDMFIQNFKIDEGESPADTSVITLLGEAVWIDEGLPKDFLREKLLNGKNAQHGKNGRYAVVPFNHGPGQGHTNTPSYNLDLVNVVHEAMKKQKIPWATIARDDQGRPIMGKVYSQKIDSRKIKHPTRWFGGAGMGEGPLGAPRQGHTGTPFLAGAAVYQRMDKVFDKVQKKEVEKPGRYVYTFRTISDAHPEKWHHPGLEPTNLMQSGYDWAMETLEKEILPKLVEAYF